jgi:hypothetical protein
MDGEVGKAKRSKHVIVIPDFTPTERTQVHRLPEQRVFDRKAGYRILDEGLVCHFGLPLEADAGG